MTLFGTSAKYHRRGAARPASGRATTHDLVDASGMIASTGSPLAPESFDFVYDAIKPRRASRLDLGRHRHRRLLRRSAIPTAPVWRGEIQGPGLGMAVDVFDDDGPAAAARQGRARLHAAVPVDAGRLLERSRRREIPRRLFRALPRRLVPRRFRRMDRAWRHDHPRPLRRHAQSRRRAHRHRRDLSPRSSRSRRCSRRSPSARTGTTTCASCCSCGCATGVALDDALSDRIKATDPRRRHARAMCRRRSSRSPTFRAPSRARSSSSRCATSCMAAPVKNSEALANPEALELFRDLPELKA